MIRFLILAGYFELTMYLQISGKLDQYINTHYAYLALHFHGFIISFSGYSTGYLDEKSEIAQPFTWKNSEGD